MKAKLSIFAWALIFVIVLPYRAHFCLFFWRLSLSISYSSQYLLKRFKLKYLDDISVINCVSMYKNLFLKKLMHISSKLNLVDLKLQPIAIWTLSAYLRISSEPNFANNDSSTNRNGITRTNSARIEDSLGWRITGLTILLYHKKESNDYYSKLPNCFPLTIKAAFNCQFNCTLYKT